MQPAAVQDRDGASSVLKASQSRFPFVQKVFADSVYADEKVANATTVAVEIVRKLADRLPGSAAPLGGRALLCLINRNRRLA